MSLTLKDLERFLQKVVDRPEGGCWRWGGSFFPNGYGQFYAKVDGKRTSLGAHRVSYEAFHGPIPEGLVVRHKCDNPGCVAPHHLELGTHQDNHNDKVERGRQARGEGHGLSRLTAKAVRAIDQLLGQGDTNVKLAAQFGVCPATIGHIRRGRVWTHITGRAQPKRGNQQARA